MSQLRASDSAVILDYSRTASRKPGLLCCIRTLWSHRARREFAHTASCAQSLAILAVVSILAAALTTSHRFLLSIFRRAAGAGGGFFESLLKELSPAAQAVARYTLQFAPLYFCCIAALLALVACLWPRRSPGPVSWAQRFSLLCAAIVPIVWFFLLLQTEGFAPFFAADSILASHWNPMTNSVRFGALLLGLLLLALWVIDVTRLYQSLRSRNLAQAHR